MIVVRLIGGLGNQMFQYAAARALAERTGGELLFDVGGFADYADREFALGGYALRGRVATADELARFPGPGPERGRLGRLAERAGRALGAGRGGPAYYRQPHFHYDPGFERLCGDVYLDGYFQSERYFAPVAGALRAELAWPGPLASEAEAIAARIAAEESVALHVRRGDYVSDPHIAATHGALGPDYHRRAVALAAEGLAAPSVFVFTDDPDWVRTELDLGAPFTLVDGGSPQADLHLMSQCRRKALANSSFSWWAAWLGAGQGRRVVAPRRWFGEERMRTRRMDDLYPQGWVLT